MSFLADWFVHNSLAVLLCTATIVSTLWLFRANGRLGLKPWQIALLAVTHTLLGLLSVKIFAVIEGLGDASAIGNMSLFGGMAFLPIFYAALARFGRLDVSDVFDVLTVCLVGTLFFARINCIVSGCCLGAFIPGTGIRYPTRELELVFYVALLAYLIPCVLSGRRRGQVFPIYMVSYGCFRFLTEFFRVEEAVAGPFHGAHLWSVIAVVLGCSILAEFSFDKGMK